ncbi:MAG: phosphatidylinositol-specific phospholipase C domain-containing protein [Candidatus Marinimicrobia bacterium]|nr:phosphatidylinositol-specific phospholipase C domain-containing protein [Candidatus Neomarinimicrobiota bacterium]
MKKSLFIIRFLIIFIILFSLNSCKDDVVTTPEEEALLGDSSLPYHWKTWMGHIPDSLYLSQITILGSHDAGADKSSAKDEVGWPEWHYVICHDFHFKNQLKLGVRWFDIRLYYHDGGALSIHHGTYYLNKNFDDILRWSIDFLQDYPQETVILMLKQEHSNESAAEFGRAVYHKMENHGLSHFYLDYKVPTLGEVRGKIVIVRKFDNQLGKDFGVYFY